uniref:Death domain-containing protein n=1 Tax=Amphimedon queenslandica TaxID=400682 RepID=A0A1X7TJB8_AMPQE
MSRTIRVRKTDLSPTMVRWSGPVRFLGTADPTAIRTDPHSSNAPYRARISHLAGRPAGAAVLFREGRVCPSVLFYNNNHMEHRCRCVNGVGSNTEYEGCLLYEEKGLNDYAAIFTVAKDGDTLHNYIGRKHPGAEIGHYIYFTFVGDYIQLKFDTPQERVYTAGWSIKPDTEPCQIKRSHVDKVGKPGDHDPPSCSISVRATLDAVPRLRYTISVEGVVIVFGLDTVVIRRTLRIPVLHIEDLKFVLDSLNEALLSQKEWKPLGDALGLYHHTLLAIEHNNRGIDQYCLRECLEKWLNRADNVDARGGPTIISLHNALESIDEKAAADYIRKNIINKGSAELRHYCEALKTIVTCRLTKAVVQGEARVGKTAFRSLLLDEKYVKASTGIAEPRVGIHCYTERKSRHSRDTGKRYEPLSVTELEEIVKNALKSRAIQKVTSSPIENQVSKNIDEMPKGNGTTDLGNETTDEAGNGFVKGNEATDGPGNEEKVLGDGNKSLLSKEVENVLDEVQKCSGKENRLEGAQWLYLIDTGGQIAFQKLLPIFMPFAQVLILVVNISKDLSSGSTVGMNIEGKHHSDGSRYSLPVEEVVKQIISSIASGMQHFRHSYKDCKVLQDLVPEKLQILTIGTHGDKCCDVAESKRILKKKLDEIIEENDDCKFVEDDSVCIHVHEIDGRIAAKAIEKRKNDVTTESSLKMADYVLEKNGKDIKIHFFYYFFDIVLRVAAKEGCGVLRLSTCKSLGEDLKLEEKEVIESLNFLHHINSIIYYHDSKVFDDNLVFVDIGSLIGILKQLVGRVYNTHLNRKDKDSIIKGIISKSKFEEICENQLDCIKKELKVDDIAMKLLNLFVELSIATPIDDEYFIPALLPVRDVTDITPYKDREPLLFYFKKATPMGLFCSVVTCLLSWSCYKIASIESNFSNHIKLEYHTKGIASFRLYLVEQVNCIEVHCEQQRGEGIVREDLKKAINFAAKKHNLSDSHSDPDIRFYCPCKRGPGSAGSGTGRGGITKRKKKHMATVENVTKSTLSVERHIFRCSEKDNVCEFDEKKKWNSWLDNFALVNSQMIIMIIGSLLLLLSIAGVVEYYCHDTVLLMTIPVGVAASLLLLKGLLKWEIYEFNLPLALTILLLIAVQTAWLLN